MEYDKFGEIFAGSITDEPVENKEYQYYDLGIKCINCKENSYTLPPHIIYIKGNGIIDFQGKCCICNNIKHVDLNKYQKAYLPEYVNNSEPNTKYENYLFDVKTGGIFPLAVLVPAIIAGISSGALAISALSGATATIINLIRGNGITSSNLYRIQKFIDEQKALNPNIKSSINGESITPKNEKFYILDI